MDLQVNLGEIRALYASGQTTEHSFRPAVAKLFASIDPDIVVVDKACFEAGPDCGKVWTNASQSFEGVPTIAWDFPVGGYQPAQKRLKNRKGRAASYDDVRHYQKIIKILAETNRIMRKIGLPSDGSAQAE